MPTVRPFPRRAPAAAASMTPVLPPLMRITPRRASCRPTSNASLRTALGASPAPMTAIVRARCTRSASQQGRKIGEVSDLDLGRRNSFRERLLMLVNPRHRNSGALRSHDIFMGSVADEQHLLGAKPKRVQHPLEEGSMRL